MESNELEMKKFFDVKRANGQSRYTIKSQRYFLKKFNSFFEPVPTLDGT